MLKRVMTAMLAVLLLAGLSAPACAEMSPDVGLPFEEYGQFTDVYNEAQLKRRAEWFYGNYISALGKLPTGGRLFSVEEIMNDIRIMNGSLMQNRAGEFCYKETDVLAAAMDLHTVANYDSFSQYGTQIFFTPTAPLFVDGSYVQKGAIELDRAMERVVEAIRAEDDEAFMDAAKAWGCVVAGIFSPEEEDSTGCNCDCCRRMAESSVRIDRVEAPYAFALYHAMSSKYASTVLEYASGRGLTVMIPAGRDAETGETRLLELDRFLDSLNEDPLDPAEEDGPSLPEVLYIEAKDYYNRLFNTARLASEEEAKQREGEAAKPRYELKLDLNTGHIDCSITVDAEEEQRRDLLLSAEIQGVPTPIAQLRSLGSRETVVSFYASSGAVDDLEADTSYPVILEFYDPVTGELVETAYGNLKTVRE